MTDQTSLNNSHETPIALTIAGSDSSGGAGIQADLKAFSALGAYGASVITAVTAQNTKTVSAVHEIPVDIIKSQIEAVFNDLTVKAVKVGMLSSSPIIETVAEQLNLYPCALVLDPVMVAKSGHLLLSHSAIDTLRKVLLPQATLLTPNLPEAAQLLDVVVAETESDMESQGKALLDLGVNAVLMKGGHGKGCTCVDLLIQKGTDTIRFEANRINTPNTHGTGCTLSAAITAGLACQLSLEVAVGNAHIYLQDAIKFADNLNIGSGHGPVHHFHRWWGTE